MNAAAITEIVVCAAKLVTSHKYDLTSQSPSRRHSNLLDLPGVVVSYNGSQSR